MIFKIFLIVVLIKISAEDELFKQNLGSEMKIGLSDKGYKSVQLKCGSNSMLIDLETEEDFSGVIYTRGSFYDRKSSCYLDPGERGGRAFQIKFPLDECQTKHEGDVFSNVLVLQHDKELIMPGDAAFNLECDFRSPRDVTVNANLHNEKSIVSRISLTDADPGERAHSRSKRHTIESYTNSVILTPEKLVRLFKEEL